jgi:hypothetical protein
MMKGPSLLALSVAAIAVTGWLNAQSIKAAREGAAAPSMVQTTMQDSAECGQSGIDTPFGRLGCSERVSQTETRQQQAGGALFITRR